MMYFYKSFNLVKTPRLGKIIANLAIAFMVFITLFLTFVPWQQTARGKGRVIAIDPNERIQYIQATIPGRIEKWYVRDGQSVKKGEKIVLITDNDPKFIERLKLERDAIFQKYQAAKEATETSLINYKRQVSLFKQGLSARTKLEKAKINYKKLLAAEAAASANLAKAEVAYSRQNLQELVAPTDGVVMRTKGGAGQVFVKQGDQIATFTPDVSNNAVEVFIDGNDLPLVFPGRTARLQFEGWPAVQFSGWPSLAVGTFAGEVISVDPSTIKQGKFRVLISPKKGEKWPGNRFLRQGTRVLSWILLDNVSIGYEVWRQFNGFPPEMDSVKEYVFKKAKPDEKYNKEKYYKDLYK